MGLLLIIQTIIPLAFFVISMLPIFTSGGTIPSANANGNQILESKKFHYSMMENLMASDSGFLSTAMMILIGATVVFSVLSIFMRANKTVTIISHILFVVTVVVFLINLFIALSVHRSF